MSRQSYTAAILTAIIASAATAGAQGTLPPPIVVNSPIVVINGSTGDQTDPHVDKNIASYTDVPTNQIRYYNFLTQTDTAIPSGSALFDVLSGVSGGRIAFTRVETDRNAIFVFDVTSGQLHYPGTNVGEQVNSASGIFSLVLTTPGDQGTGN